MATASCASAWPLRPFGECPSRQCYHLRTDVDGSVPAVIGQTGAKKTGREAARPATELEHRVGLFEGATPRKLVEGAPLAEQARILMPADQVVDATSLCIGDIPPTAPVSVHHTDRSRTTTATSIRSTARSTGHCESRAAISKANATRTGVQGRSARSNENRSLLNDAMKAAAA